MNVKPRFKAVPDSVRIRGYSQRIASLATKYDIDLVVSGLKFEHLDPMVQQPTDIGNFQRKNPQITVRLDRQANTSLGEANFQVQVNDSALKGNRPSNLEKTTIAQVLVSAEIFRLAANDNDPGTKRQLETTTRSALIQSAASSGFQFKIERA